jgi:hypothetical protein
VRVCERERGFLNCSLLRIFVGRERERESVWFSQSSSFEDFCGKINRYVIPIGKE